MQYSIIIIIYFFIKLVQYTYVKRIRKTMRLGACTKK